MKRKGYNKQLMNIGIDIDGVIANTLPLLVDELNAFFNKNIKYKDVNNYDIGKVYNLDNIQIENFIKAKGSLLVTDPKPMPGALECLKTLNNQLCFILISARNKKFRTETVHWLKRNNFDWDNLILLGSHDKADTCIEFKIKVLIEDSLKNALQVSVRGIPVILLDAPYNQGPVNDLVQRVYSWPEICQSIMHLLQRQK